MDKATKAVMFSSTSSEHETPQDLFDQLDAEFHFTLDPCATTANAKCKKYYTIEDDGLIQSWKGKTVWVNPPYGRYVSAWIEKAITESQQCGATVAMLLPARSDTRWFHSLVALHASEVRFISGRLRFVGTAAPAPFPSILAILRPEIVGPYSWHTWKIR